ncbi:MAG: efflux RND transporter periplasmic adaptor subunit [Chloroherpetonaceae bacterium]|nr:efflux RND transporter periplasmic adaptor subunit [Chloroherpetonaceae bacterium]
MKQSTNLLYCIIQSKSLLEGNRFMSYTIIRLMCSIYLPLTLSSCILLFSSCSSGSKDKLSISGNDSVSSNASINTVVYPKLLYHCPMHPQVTSERPSVCPICQMDLVLKSQSSTITSDGLVYVDDRSILFANVKTAFPKFESLVKSIRSAGYIQFAEPNIRVYSSRFSGRIERLYVNETGKNISKHEKLFSIYSPTLIQAQKDYLVLKQRKDPLAQVGKEKLLLLGLQENQIDSLEMLEEPPFYNDILSPFSGIIIEKSVFEGETISEGQELFKCVDTNLLWVICELSEIDAQYVSSGDYVQIQLQSNPSHTVLAKVSFVNTIINPETRTLQIRIPIRNSSGSIKPNMFVSVSFEKELHRSLLIPFSAVILTGEKSFVWVKIKGNHYKLTEVKLGEKGKDFVQVLNGLSIGDEVVYSGAYLIDSEYQLTSNQNH